MPQTSSEDRKGSEMFQLCAASGKEPQAVHERIMQNENTDQKQMFSSTRKSICLTGDC